MNKSLIKSLLIITVLISGCTSQTFHKPSSKYPIYKDYKKRDSATIELSYDEKFKRRNVELIPSTPIICSKSEIFIPKEGKESFVVKSKRKTIIGAEASWADGNKKSKCRSFTSFIPKRGKKYFYVNESISFDNSFRRPVNCVLKVYTMRRGKAKAVKSWPVPKDEHACSWVKLNF